MNNDALFRRAVYRLRRAIGLQQKPLKEFYPGNRVVCECEWRLLEEAKKELFPRLAKPAETTVLEFGLGELVVDTGAYAGHPAVFIEKAGIPGTPGEPAPKNETHPLNEVKPGSVVLLFPSERYAELVSLALISRPAEPEIE